QGNLDPNVLFAHASAIEKEAHKVLDSFGTPHTDPKTTGPTHIFNLGHGISQFTNPDSVTVLAKTVIEHSEHLRRP
ncbi:MAG: uroporphyrinogen decarboxylase, partial [Burkholderiaceae bacterium]|nr:uroporphyrinogen decarboxylase [Burkholderiaceae bacterium]